jgi:tRNA-2-methylthio-N6-dimethylallyladenosine synthase
MNEHDSERIAGLLESDGYVQALDQRAADVVVLNTCCIRENADTRLYGELGHLAEAKRANPDLKIVVSGCLAQKDRDLIQQRAPWVDVVFGTHNVGSALDLLYRSQQDGPVIEILDESQEFPSALPARRDLSYSAWVTIQVGCNNSCAFCIVPSVRGEEISRPFGDVIDEVRQLAQSGVTEITLLGQNVNSYGRDLTLGLRANDDRDRYIAGERWASAESLRAQPLFADLLRAVGSVDGVERVRYMSPHPKDMREDVLLAMAETPSVCNLLHYPLQSGSNEILSAMHRGYTAERYLERLAQARALIDDLAVTTDVIVGFPGETEQHFVETLEVFAEARFDSAYTFEFSPRPGTEAAELVDRFVDPAVVRDRFARLDVIAKRNAHANHEARVGRTEECLVEGPSKRDASHISARTRQNKLIHFAASTDHSTANKPGSLVTVEVTSAAPYHLRGELREVLRGPKHKTKIPLLVQ